ncbi:hypothetical protein LJR084_007164 [Variovorax sp. LjRoot84]
MMIADGFLLEAKGAEVGATPASTARPLLVKPWISVPADIVVCSLGARQESAGHSRSLILHAGWQAVLCRLDSPIWVELNLVRPWQAAQCMQATSRKP